MIDTVRNSIPLTGVFIYAFVVGSASSLMANLDHKASLRKRHTDDVNYYMNFHNVPNDLQKKVIRE
jgi:hypothetical protein